MQKANWSSPTGILELNPHVVDIWRVPIDIAEESGKVLESTLSKSEVERAAHFHFAADRDRFIVSHGCLRDILGRYLHCQPHQINFSSNDYGKPALREGQLEFNLSHSADFALIAIAQQRRVGIDLERIRKGISSHVIARQYFSKAEVAESEALPIEQREVAFFLCWTRKEAYSKAQGLGLSLPLESFDVSLSPNEPAILRATRPEAEETAHWTLLSLEVDSRYAAAVAVEHDSQRQKNQNLEFRMWQWQTNS
jgi:4'-phosphopantetheinyl transferase